MTKPIEPPKSWRDLTHAELIALLEDGHSFFLPRPRDLVWAQWTVASKAHLVASGAEQQAWTAERNAFDAWSRQRDSRSLAAYEAAQAATKRRKATYERLRRHTDALYALHDQLCEAERS